MKKTILKLLTFFAVGIAVLSNIPTAKAQTYASPEQLEELKTDIDFWLGQKDASMYILWQYSGPVDKYFENDRYSFFQGSPVCQTLKEKSDQYPGKKIGVNIHSLGNKDITTIKNTFSYLSSECGVKVVRIFGTPDRGGIPAVEKVLSGAGSIDVIVAIADYANGSEPILPGAIRSNPTSWYESGYTTTGYLNYAKNTASQLKPYANLYALELANEPHCSGIQACVPKYNNWVKEVSQAIRVNNPNVKISIGQMASQNTTRGDSPINNEYGTSNLQGSINLSSAHHYGTNEVNINVQARAQTGHEFYIGEAGFAFGEIPSGDGNTQEEPKRPLDEGFYWGAYSCKETADPEFNPLRPYPANACDPLIPQSIESAQSMQAPDYKKYITYSCGNTLAPEGREAFDPYGENGKYDALKVDNGIGQTYAHTVCEKNGLAVTCYRSSSYDVEIDLKDANLGILGDTQNPNLTDEQKVNEYLSYYLTGVPQVSDHVTDVNEKELKRIVNFAGPLRKLLPWDLQNAQARSTIASEGDLQENIHNYSVKDGGFLGIGDARLKDFKGNTPPKRSEYENYEDYRKAIDNWRYGTNFWSGLIGGYTGEVFKRLFNLQTKFAKLLQNVSLAGVEDTAGEFIVTVFGPGDRQDPDIVGQQTGTNGITAPAQLTITNSSAASGSSGSTITPPDTYQPPPPDENPVSCGKDLKIMPFGDSITKGEDRSGTPYSPGGYRGPLRDNLLAEGYTIDMVGNSNEDATLEMSEDSEHEGWGARDTNWLKGRLPEALNEASPNAILIHVGTNKLTSLGVQTNIENLKSMISTIKAKDSKIAIFVAQIIQTPQYPITNTRDVPEFNRRIREEIDPIENVVVVDMYSAVDPALIPDGVHPDKAGYEIMARVWTDEITANCR